MHCKCVAILLLLFAVVGCERSDPRIKKSIDALHWSGGNTNDQRVRDSLRTALEKSTPASLAKVELVSATAWLPVGKGSLHADWIGARPGADALRIIFPDGTIFDFPIDPIDIAENERTSADLLIYHASIFAQRDQPQIWEKMIASPDAKAVLLEKAIAASNTIAIGSFTPTPPSTAPDAGKMIVTVDSGGRTRIYLLSHAVNAGDMLATTDFYQADFSYPAELGVKKEDWFEVAGPTAYVGRRFAASHVANETLTTGMFITRPSPTTNK
jgi:hypothetical protein